MKKNVEYKVQVEIPLDNDTSVEDVIYQQYGDCCYIDGFILKDTIHIQSISAPFLENQTILYHVSFKAECITLYEGEILKHIKIIGKTKLGYKVEHQHCVGYILKEFTQNKEFNIGQYIDVEVITYKYKFKDTEITFIGKYIKTSS